MHYLGLQHKQEREEGRAQTPPPAKSAYIAVLDKATFIASIVGPLTAIPQVYEIFSTHQATGVSVSAWVLMTIVVFPWVPYGFAHKNKPIIFNAVLWEIMNILVVIGALMYR